MENHQIYSKAPWRSFFVSKQKRLKNALSVVLAFALATTMCMWPTSGTTQAYAESTATTPSLSTYADNKALTDTTFAPNAEGTPNYVGTINFGKGADDNAASWYLLGGDGENVDVLAAVSLADDEAFQEKGLDGGMSEAGFTPDTDTWNDVIYVNGTKPSKVWWNNYGASDARVTLKKLATNTSKFTSAEQAMMNTTTVETTDVMNKTTDGSAYLTYKTTDTLYLAATGKNVSIAPPYFPPLSDVPINVNNKTLNLAYYPGNYFYWLRTPNWSGSSQDYNMVFCAIPWDDYEENGYRYGVWTLGANIQVDVGRAQMRPATNLNLSSVLFASAAPITSTGAAQTNIEDDTAMNLRFEATDATSITKNEIGSGFFSSDVITTTKGTGETVTLFVQGNDGENDWYYAKSLSSDTTTVKASDIGTDVDLTKCKIWLETTGSDGMTYAVNIYENFAVQFFVDGAEQTNLAQTVEKGSTATDPSSQLSKEGYTLDGWYKSDSCTGDKFDFSGAITGNEKLYAKWVQNPEPKDWTRLAGSNRYATNAEVVADGKWETGGTVILATGDKFPDALSASGLAGIKSAPVVLTVMGDEINDEAKVTIESLAPKTVYIMGDANTIGEGQKAQLEDMGIETVERLGGSNRMETAAAIYEAGSGSWGSTAVVTWGDNFADALSVAPGAYAAHMPIFLTDTNANLDTKYIEQLKAGGIEHVLALGQENRVSEASVDALEAADIDVVRLAGSTRIETSVDIAKWTHENVGATYDGMLVATADKFPDALGGGALAGKRGSVLVLANDGDNGVYAADEIVANNADTIEWGTFLGDTNSISENVANYFIEASKNA